MSDYGRVRSVVRYKSGSMGVRAYGGKILKPIYSFGYQRVNLTDRPRREQCRVHVLVLNAFVGKKEPQQESCHNDGDRANNSLSNLRWDTRKNNHADKKLHGTWQGGDRNPNAVLDDNKVREIRLLHGKHTNKQIASMFCVSKGTIEKVLYGMTWTHVK